MTAPHRPPAAAAYPARPTSEQAHSWHGCGCSFKLASGSSFSDRDEDVEPGCLPGLRPDLPRDERFFAGSLSRGASDDGGRDGVDIADDHTDMINSPLQLNSYAWRRPTDTRNRIVHGYWSIGISTLYTTARDYLAPVVKALRQVLDERELSDPDRESGGYSNSPSARFTCDVDPSGR